MNLASHAVSQPRLTARPVEETLETLLDFQYRHDQVFHPEILLMTKWDQAVHCLAHLYKVNGRIADLADKMDHQAERHVAGGIVDELAQRRIPDLLIFSLKLMKLFDVSAEAAFLARMASVERRRMTTGSFRDQAHFTPLPAERNLAAWQWYQREHDQYFHREVVRWKRRRHLKHICLHVCKVGGVLGDWTDKEKHQELDAAVAVEQELTERRLPDLLIYALILAYLFRLDLSKAYFARIEQVEREGIR